MPILASALWLVVASTSASDHQKGSAAATLEASDARESLDRALTYLVTTQHEDGSWASGAIEGLLDSGYSVASFYDWQVAAHALACLALLECDETRVRRACLESALRWYSETRLPKRGRDWDNDTVWAGLCGFVTGLRVSHRGP